MRRVQRIKELDTEPLPCEYFDLIGGTSTGGLIALLLGRLRLCTECAINAYIGLGRQVFSDKKWFFQDGTFKATNLRQAIQQQIELAFGEGCRNARMIDPKNRNPGCKV